MRVIHFIVWLTVLIIGGVLIYGAWQRWPSLVDPPEDQWIGNSQAAIKKFFGKQGVLLYTYGLGVMFIFGALYGLLHFWWS